MEPVGDGPTVSPPGPAPRGVRAHQAARNAVIRATAEVLGKVATLGWTIIAVRVLTQDDFGALSYALNLMLLVSALPAWGFDTGLVVRGARSGDDVPALYSRTLAWKTLLGVPVLGLVGLGVSWSRPSLQAVVVLFLVLAAGLPELWSMTARSAATVRRYQAAVATALVLQRVLTAAAIVLALVLGTGVVGVAVAFLAGTTVGWLAHVRATGRLDIHFRRRLVTREGLASLWSQTWVVGCGSVVLVVLFRADSVLLGTLAGDQAVAEYAVAYRLLETVLFISFAINQSVLPVMSDLATADRGPRAFEQAVAVAGFVYLPFAAVSLVEGKQVIELLFGATYAASSAPILAWLAPAPLLFGICFFGESLLLSRDRARSTLVGALLATVANLGLNLWLIPGHQGVGAAIATSASFVVQLGSLLVCLRLAGLEVRVVRPLAVGLAAGAVLCALLVLLHLPLLVELAAGAVVYLAVWFVLARRFEPLQVEVVRGLARRG